MKLFVCLFLAIVLAPVASPQIQLVSEDYFPADSEFQELHKVVLEKVFEDPDRISELENGPLFLDAGCDKYARRVYTTENAGSLSIDVATLADARASYSLLTLLGDSGIQDGPPGDVYISSADTLLFARGREWIRLKSHGVSAELMKQIANSMSNRIEPHERRIPALIAHLPSPGYDPSSLRYFPEWKFYETFSGNQARKYLKFNSDVEMVQAHYNLEDNTGNLFLLSFPTPQVSEEYFEALPGLNPAKNSEKALYTKKVGPLVAILEGAFDPGAANRILSHLKFEYSIRWIYDERNQNKIVWGIPTHILGTVVRSLLFVALLSLISIAAGTGLAFLRFGLRGHRSGKFSDQPEQTEIIRLRLR
jgi:hypothetical protein